MAAWWIEEHKASVVTGVDYGPINITTPLVLAEVAVRLAWPLSQTWPSGGRRLCALLPKWMFQEEVR